MPPSRIICWRRPSATAPNTRKARASAGRGERSASIMRRKSPATAVAEMAFHRLLFFAESPQTPWPSDAGEYTAFAAAVADQELPRPDRAAAGPPTARLWIDPIRYEPCQDLADAARAADAAVIRYELVRDPLASANVAVLQCAAFAEPEPLERQTWRMRLGPSGSSRRSANFLWRGSNSTVAHSRSILGSPNSTGKSDRRGGRGAQRAAGAVDAQPFRRSRPPFERHGGRASPAARWAGGSLSSSRLPGNLPAGPTARSSRRRIADPCSASQASALGGVEPSRRRSGAEPAVRRTQSRHSRQDRPTPSQTCDGAWLRARARRRVALADVSAASCHRSVTNCA